MRIGLAMAIKKARRGFTYWVKGKPRTVPAGTLVDFSRVDAELKKREHFFVDVEAATLNRPVETATQVPGESRAVTLAKQLTTKKPVVAKEGTEKKKEDKK